MIGCETIVSFIVRNSGPALMQNSACTEIDPSLRKVELNERLLTFRLGRSLLRHRHTVMPVSGEKRQDHGHAAAILGVFGVRPDKVSFLKLDREENVGRRGKGKDKMRNGHQRG